jgi:predicted DNA-binding protein
MRVTIDIPDEMDRRLKQAAKERGTTMRQIILNAIDRVLNEPPEDSIPAKENTNRRKGRT